jgi:peroxiredoxin
MMFTLPRLALASGLLAVSVLPLGLPLQDAAKPKAPPAAAQDKGKADKPADKAGKKADKQVAAVGEKAPDFTLKSVKDESVTLSALTAEKKIVVLEWFNPDCPISRAYHTPESVMGLLASRYADKGVVWLAINSGAPGKQGAGKERNAKAVEEFGVSYPVLIDEDGAVGKLYDARTTPHMFVIDAEGVVRYAGAIDNGTPQTKGETNYVKEAVEALLAGKDVSTKESRPFGCGVKYAD